MLRRNSSSAGSSRSSRVSRPWRTGMGACSRAGGRLCKAVSAGGVAGEPIALAALAQPTAHVGLEDVGVGDPPLLVPAGERLRPVVRLATRPRGRREELGE